MSYKIEHCDNFLYFLQANFKQPETPRITNLSTLAELIREKKYLYSNSRDTNIVDNKIIKQIDILRLEILKDFNNLIKITEDNKKIEQLSQKYKNADKLKGLNKDILDKSIIKLRDFILNNEFFYVYDIIKSYNIKKEFLHKIISFFINNKLFSTIIYFIVSISCFFAYFFFSIEYIPDIACKELLYIGALVSGLLLICILLVCTLLLSILGAYYKDLYNNVFSRPKMWIFYPLSGFIFFLSLILTTLIKSKIFNIQTFFESTGLFYFALFLVFYIAISFCVAWTRNNRNNVFFIIETFIGLIIFFLCFTVEINQEKIMPNLFFYLSTLHFCTLIISNTENIRDFQESLTATILVMFATGMFIFPESAIKKLNYGNINYEFITLENKYSDSVPEEICEPNQEKYFYINKQCKTADEIKVVSLKNKTIQYVDNNDQSKSNYIYNLKIEYLNFFDSNNTKIDRIYSSEKIEFNNNTLKFITNNKQIVIHNAFIKIDPKANVTYKTNQGNIVKIYNIKALSTIGRFYLLKTTDNKVFEIDSNLIKSKKKEREPLTLF